MINVNDKKIKNLCAQCGTCFSLCPKENIRIVRDNDMNFIFDVIDEKICADCGICIKACPAIEIDFNKLEAENAGPRNNIYIGRYSSIYIAEAADSAIKRKAASGGAVTALLGYLLDKGIADAAVLARPSNNPYEPEVFIAGAKDELLASSGSMYYPVPVNTGLKQALKSGKRIAAVGLPCHIAAIRKAEEAGIIDKGKIVFKFGLFCGWNTSFSVLDFLVRRAGIKEMKAVNRIRFRQGDWPGNIDIELKDGRTIELPGEFRDYVGHIYMPKRCALCPDQMNELADASFGDAWGMKRESGSFDSIVISRGRGIDTLIREAASSGYLRLKPIEEEDAVKSQLTPALFKKRGVTARAKLNRLFKIDTPTFLTSNKSGKGPRPDMLDYLGALVLSAVTSTVIRNKKAKHIVNDILPLSVIKSYAFLERNLLTHHEVGKKLLGKMGLAQ